ncbi:MAG: hypothetical protein RL398_1749 [Planctomycetota bacterium]
MLRAPANELSFGVRSRVAWSRGRPTLANEPKGELFAGGTGGAGDERAELAVRLRERFGLGELFGRSTRRTYLANLDLLDCLGRFEATAIPPEGPDGVVRAVDVGSGDFHYATALARWLAMGGERARRIVLRGLELDGHGIYADGHSRADHAKAHAALATWDRGHVQYEVADFRTARLPEQDFVSVLYPFVFAYPLLQWGLPLSQWRPAALLERAAEVLRPGGILLIANQTDAEAQKTAELLARAPVARLERASWASRLVPYSSATVDRVASVWQRV